MGAGQCSDGDALDGMGMARGPEGLEGLKGLEPVASDLIHRGHHGFHDLAGVKFAAVHGGGAANGSGGGKARIGVDVDLAHAMADAADDFSTGTPEVGRISPP